MKDSEKILFHKNYDYMWSKLNTTPYFVKSESQSAQAENSKNRIKGVDLLPSYTVCSKCRAKEYEPSEKAVLKIVMFYNQNIAPDVSVWQFLHEDLSKTDNFRYLSRVKFDERFIGTFYGYYFSSANSAELAGAILKIHKVGKKESRRLQATLITGFHTDEELNSALTALFENEPLTKKHFDDFYRNLPPDKMRCYYYEGTVEITERAVLILFHSCDADARKLVFTLNISKFPSQGKDISRPYVGGLAFMLLTCDSPFDTRFYQMGLINKDFHVLPLTDKRLEELLQLKTTGKDVCLKVGLDRAWYELAIQA